MNSKLKKKKVYIALCVAPIAFFLILCMAILGMSVGGVDKQMTSNSDNVVKVASKEKTVDGTSLTANNKTAHIFSSALKVYAKNDIQTKSIILTLKVKVPAKVIFYYVQEKKEAEDGYDYMIKKESFFAVRKDVSTQYVDFSFVTNDTTFLAIEVLEESTGSNINFELYAVCILI